MLQQILRDMYIEPSLLAELDDEQKHVLFCKMREEQIRRWNQREQQTKNPITNNRTNNNNNHNNNAKKKVGFLLGSDGQPWTWVMGEHSDDKLSSTISSICSSPLSPSPPTSSPISPSPPKSSPLSSNLHLDSYSTNDNTIQYRRPSSLPLKCNTVMQTNPHTNEDSKRTTNGETIVQPRQIQANKISFEIRSFGDSDLIMRNAENQKNGGGLKGVKSPSIENVQKINPKMSMSRLEDELELLVQDVAEKTSPSQDKQAWLLQKQQVKQTRESLPSSPVSPPPSNGVQLRMEPSTVPTDSRPNPDWSAADERAWQEQEKRAKEAEIQMRQVARQAREEFRRSSQLIAAQQQAVDPPQKPSKTNKPAVPPKTVALKAALPSQQATSRSRDAKVFDRDVIEDWFSSTQLDQGAVSEDGNGGPVATWFHGFLSRPDAESLLDGKAPGTFLVRVHDRIKGYVISYRSTEKVKHFLVDASQSSQCQFFGANQMLFTKLAYLVRYHMVQPISVTGHEKLICILARPEFETAVRL